MSRLKDFFMKSVCACKFGLACVKAVGVLAKATCQRWRGDRSYTISFAKFGRKWYCEVPGFPKELFEHTLMVGGAAKLLDHYAEGNIRLSMRIKVSDAGSPTLTQTSSTLTGGAFYKDLSGCVDEEIWLCPVTLFVLGKYPKNIQIHDVSRIYAPNDDQLAYILNRTIDFVCRECLQGMEYSEEEIKSLEKETRQNLEETVIAEFNRYKSYPARLTIVDDFAESMGFDWRKLFK